VQAGPPPPDPSDLAVNQPPADDGSQRFARGADDSGPVADDSPRSAGPLTPNAGSATRAPGNHRRVLLIHLVDDLRAAIAADDIEAARVTHEFIGRLLGSSATQVAANTSLMPERSNRGAG